MTFPIIGKPICFRLTHLREPERRQIAELLWDANYSQDIIDSFLVELDRSASWFLADSAAQTNAPSPAQLDKRIAQLAVTAQKITDELRALRREQPFVMEGISTWYGLNVDALIDQLVRLWLGINLERQTLKPTRGRPEMPAHERKIIWEMAQGYCRYFGDPTATQGNLFESILSLVLAATVGERSEEHVHRLAASVIKAVRKTE